MKGLNNPGTFRNGIVGGFVSSVMGGRSIKNAQAVYLPTLLFLILGLYYSPG